VGLYVFLLVLIGVGLLIYTLAGPQKQKAQTIGLVLYGAALLALLLRITPGVLLH
jgi:hypothetical protein